MGDLSEWEDRYHPRRIHSSGSAPKGWSDEFRFCPYVRADIAAAREADLRAEVERLSALLDEALEALALYSCEDGCNDCAEHERDQVNCGWTARAARAKIGESK